MQKTLLTKEGLPKLKKELKNLIDVERPNVIKDLQEARAQGDLSENADYDSARDRQAQIEARIIECQTILNNYEIIDKKYVELEDQRDKKIYKYEIVGSSESNPFENKISDKSPIAKSVLNKKSGEIVKIISKTNKPYKIKPYKVRIIKPYIIQFDGDGQKKY